MKLPSVLGARGARDKPRTATAVTLADIDLGNRTIHINHQLQRKRNMEYTIEDTKISSIGKNSNHSKK